MNSLSNSSSKDETTTYPKIRIAILILLAVAFIVLQNLSSIDVALSTSSLVALAAEEQVAIDLELEEEEEDAEEEATPRIHLQKKNKKKRNRDSLLQDQFLGRRDDPHYQQLLGARKQRRNKQFKDPYVLPANSTPPPNLSPSKPLKVGYPIFVLNLPKTGTTTLWQYFECGLGPDRAIHWWTRDGKKIGPCVEANIKANQPPLNRCGHYDVWIDFGYATRENCFFPAIHGYKALYEAYPHATFLLIPRNVDKWFHSAEGWGPMLRKWSTACRSTFFPEVPQELPISNDAFKEFYPRSIQKIQQFAQDHPDMNLIVPPPEITLSSPELGNWLEETIGIEASCWGKCQPRGKQAKCEDK